MSVHGPWLNHCDLGMTFHNHNEQRLTERKRNRKEVNTNYINHNYIEQKL